MQYAVHTSTVMFRGWSIFIYFYDFFQSQVFLTDIFVLYVLIFKTRTAARNVRLQSFVYSYQLIPAGVIL